MAVFSAITSEDVAEEEESQTSLLVESSGNMNFTSSQRSLDARFLRLERLVALSSLASLFTLSVIMTSVIKEAATVGPSSPKNSLRVGGANALLPSPMPVASSSHTDSVDEEDDVESIIEHRLRPEMISISIDLMTQDTEEAAAKSHFMDIGPFVDFADRAIDEIGLRGVYLKLFNDTEYVSMLNQMAYEGNMSVHAHLNSRPTTNKKGISFDIVPNDRDIKNGILPGSVWWMQHWLGAVTAEKFLREGSLLLEKGSNERLYDIPSYFQEILRMQRLDIDVLPFEVQHGFVWHYVATVRPDMDTYPTDLATSFCGDLLTMEPEEYLTMDKQGVGQECRHGFGHSVFYTLARRETGAGGVFSVRKQFRPGTGFTLSDASKCEAYRMCHEAPNKKTNNVCINGFWHSSYVTDVGQFTDELKASYRSDRESCGY